MFDPGSVDPTGCDPSEVHVFLEHGGILAYLRWFEAEAGRTLESFLVTWVFF